MKIIEAKSAPLKETPHKVDVRPVYNKDTAQAIHITLKPGEGLKPHLTPVDVFFYVLEGTPLIRVGEETNRVAEDHLVESPKNIVHSLSNDSGSPARILVVKAPRPTTQSKML